MHLARRLYRAIEPLHIALYFVPEQTAAVEAAGLEIPALGYFPLRAAPMGAVGPGVVAATFFNFSPDLIGMVIPSIWERVSPAAWLQIRADIIDSSYRRMWAEVDGGVASDGIVEAAALVREAAAACTVPGRPLYAANAELPFPEQPHLALFHAATLVREWRGEGHVALLVQAGLTAPEALVLHSTAGDGNARFLRGSRGWSSEAWAQAQDSLRDRGWLDSDGLATDAGRAFKGALEAETDELGRAPAELLGIEAIERLEQLVTPLRRAIVAAGTFGAATA